MDEDVEAHPDGLVVGIQMTEGVDMSAWFQQGLNDDFFLPGALLNVNDL